METIGPQRILRGPIGFRVSVVFKKRGSNIGENRLVQLCKGKLHIGWASVDRCSCSCADVDAEAISTRLKVKATKKTVAHWKTRSRGCWAARSNIQAWMVGKQQQGLDGRKEVRRRRHIN